MHCEISLSRCDDFSNMSSVIDEPAIFNQIMTSEIIGVCLCINGTSTGITILACILLIMRAYLLYFNFLYFVVLNFVIEY